MMGSREPRSRIYDGAVYARTVDPLVSGVHGFIADRMPPGERVLDACCGTGALSFRLVRADRKVVGVDLSPRNIAYAQARADTEGLSSEQIRFEVADVARLEMPLAGPYEVAVVSLALHEMPAEFRAPVLRTLTGVARRIMLVDFAVPMARNIAGLRNRAMEIVAGREHFAAFRDFSRRGGLGALVEEECLAIETTRTIDSGTLQVLTVKGAD